MKDYPYDYEPLPAENRLMWADGEWKTEPDMEAWVDGSTGFPCAILRNAVGALCGYVGVPEGHTLHGKGYFDTVPVLPETIDRKVDIPADVGYWNLLPVMCGAENPINREEGTAELWTVLHCHGGLTYASADADGGWWFGFDCSHASDYSPQLAVWISSGARVFGPETYRNVEFVKGECHRLAWQAHLYAAQQPAGLRLVSRRA